MFERMKTPGSAGKGAERNVRLLIAAAVLVAAPGLRAQMSCASAATPVAVRDQGGAELTADLTLTCTGGLPAFAGADLPRFQILVVANAAITSKDLDPTVGRSAGWNEALLLVDDPAAAAQRPCAPLDAGPPCEAIQGKPGAPNVFPARRVQDNAVVFSGVAFDPPGPEGSRKLRITNVRVDAAGLDDPFFPDEVRLTVQIFPAGGGTIAVNPAETLAARVAPGLTFGLRTAEDEPAPAAEAALVTTPAMLPEQTPDTEQSLLVRFTEGFASAFRRRNLATSSGSPAMLVGQALPGASYGTETGFYNPTFGAGSGLDQAGLADTGTRLKAVIESIPANVDVWVSQADVSPTGVTHALLTYTDADGGGAFTPATGAKNGFVKLDETNGIAVAVWEVLSSDATRIEDLTFRVLLTAGDGAPASGVATVFGAMTPSSSASAVLAPRFEETFDKQRAFEVKDVVTSAFFTVVSAASYDGVAVAPDSLAAGFGDNLAPGLAVAQGSLPLELAGSSIEMIDSAGMRWNPRLIFASPGQINFWIEPGVTVGPAVLNVLRNGRLAASGQIVVAAYAPSVFSANGDGTGVAAAELLRVSNGSTTPEPVGVYDAEEGRWRPRPVSLGPDGELLFLTLYGTGIRGRARLADVRAEVGGQVVPVIYAGAQSEYAGLDQINLGPLPRSLAGKGEVDIVLRVAGRTSNRVTVAFE
ncbi:MAG: hypothetical protein GC160_01450 [Acidobacteria bacterium]|nr:hypothetical protein [Acidobacteriota bacterium]